MLVTNAVACGASSVGIGSTGVLGCSGTVRAGGGDISGFGSGGSDVPMAIIRQEPAGL